MKTIFHRIIENEVPSHTVYESDEVYGFLDIEPVTKGHSLLIPKEYSKNIFDVPPGTYKRLMNAAQKLAAHYKDILPCSGINIVQSNGVEAEQDVPYIHVHVIPRYKDDNFSLWQGRTTVQYDLETLAEKIRL